MSRSHDARQKAKRRQAKNAPTTIAARKSHSRGLLIPLAIVLAIPIGYSAIEVLGSQAGHGLDRAEVQREVGELLDDVPQSGATLGSPEAPITLQMFADLECPTVARFAVQKLPTIIDTWIRSGVVKLEYRSLKTDTASESVLTRQDVAALAAGKQNRMWDYVLTFLRERVPRRIDFATERFLADIGAQVPGLERERWLRDREGPQLLTQVLLSMHRAQVKELTATPAFLIGHSGGQINRRIGPKTEWGPLLDSASIERAVQVLRDAPSSTFEVLGLPPKET